MKFIMRRVLPCSFFSLVILTQPPPPPLFFPSAVCPPVWDFFHSNYGGGPVIARGDANIFDAVVCDFLLRSESHRLVM
jgi:hypothetical protein